MKSTAGVGGEKKDLGDSKKKAADDAINSLLFTEALTKKEIAKRAMEKLAAKEKAAKDKAAEKEPDKRDIYTDSRDKGAAEDSMENWDEEKLREAVNKKMGGQGQRCQTDIICKHFLDAVEKRTYGWFWECPNGGDKCQYRHALPAGYVLKSEVKEVEDKSELLEDRIERQRRALTTRTPRGLRAGGAPPLGCRRARLSAGHMGRWGRRGVRWAPSPPRPCGRAAAGE